MLSPRINSSHWSHSKAPFPEEAEKSKSKCKYSKEGIGVFNSHAQHTRWESAPFFMQASQKLSVNKMYFWVYNVHIKNTVYSYQLYRARIIRWQARERLMFFELIIAYLSRVWIFYIHTVILQVELFVLERRTHSTTIQVYIYPANVSKTFPSCKQLFLLPQSF